MKKIMFCGGGSAGHVIPNLAIIDEIIDRYEVCYIGTSGIEENICRNNGIRLYKFDAVKFQRGKILCNLAIPFKLVKSIKSAGKIIEKVKPDLLVCKGGYVCIPPAFAAKKRGIPVITHESDIDAGLANKIISKKCEKVLTTFSTTASKFKNGVYVGSPMRKNLFNRDKIQARKYYNLDNRPTVIVFGGGSGSKIINANLRKIIIDLCKSYNVIHLCGKGNSIDTNVYGYRQIEFADDMGLIYACADAAVARCGSNSANELIALKIPTVFIPLENSASRGDQVKNAEYFHSLGLCRVLKEKELSPEKLKTEIHSVLNDGNLKAALSSCKIECGNQKIINQIKLALE